MNKKIIAIIALMLTLVFVFAACKKEEYKVSYTVPVEDGEVIEVYEDEDGSEFVTNMDGDKIPVTTGKDGSLDDVRDLVTATTSPTTTEKSPASTNATGNSNGTTNPPSSTNAPSSTETTTTTTTTETTTKGKIEIGADSAADSDTIKEDSISIDEIFGRK